MYHSNSSAVPGHELPSEAECSHDWRSVIDWKNSSCWWNQGEDYCSKSSCPQQSPGLDSVGTGTAREGLLLELGEADLIPYTGWKSLWDLGCVAGCEERDGTPGFVPGHVC